MIFHHNDSRRHDKKSHGQRGIKIDKCKYINDINVLYAEAVTFKNFIFTT